MVELRKRKTPPPAPVRTTKKKPISGEQGMTKLKDPQVVKESQTQPVTESTPVHGQSVALSGFGGEIETSKGEKTTLESLVNASSDGIALFTYPKASTPGCTTQACLFRDAYDPLTSTGLSIYGLSTDSPKANASFKSKHSLPFELLCDPNGTLVKAIGMAKAPKGTKRGVFVISKEGEVLACESGGPQVTVDVVRKVIDKMGGTKDKSGESKPKDKEIADVAGEVADTAKKLDV